MDLSRWGTAMRSRMALSFRSLSTLAVVSLAAAAILLGTSTPGQAADPIGATAAQVKSGETAAEPKNILFLHSFGPNFQPWATWSREISHELIRQSPWPLDIQEQSLLTARGGDDPSEVKLVEYLGALYTRQPPDLIVAMGAPAARFVQQHRLDLFPTTPMLLAAVEVSRVDKSMLSAQDAVVAVRTDYAVLFENILRLLPETKAIAIIVGNSPGNEAVSWAGEQRRMLGPLLGNRVELIFYNELPFENILKQVASLPPHSAIFYQQMVVDGAGAIYGDKEPLKRIYEVANAPIFSFDQSYLDGQIVGGPMWSSAEGAGPTAAVGVRILGGEKPGDIKVPPIGFSAPKYDWRQLQRWNISESRLPPGSEILFREPTAWQRYSWQIALIIAVILLQAGLISALLHEHRRRQLAEVQARQRMAELAHVNRFSTAGELTASIAHEINQPLGSILTNAETAQVILKSASPDIAELNEIVGDIVRDDRRATEVIRSMRNLLKKSPFELKDIDLNDLVRDTVQFLFFAGRRAEYRTGQRDHAGHACDPRRPRSASTSHSESCHERDRRDGENAGRTPHHQHPDFRTSIILPGYPYRIADPAFPRKS